MFDKNYSPSGNEISDFTDAFLECALWTATDEEGNPLDENYSMEDYAEETIAKAKKECEEFILANMELLHGLDPKQCGHDFSLTRDGHGTGFWDRGYGKVGEELSEICRPYGEAPVYAGDDGKLYIFG